MWAQQGCYNVLMLPLQADGLVNLTRTRTVIKLSAKGRVVLQKMYNLET